MSYFFNDNCDNLDTLKTLVELVSQNRLGKLEIKEGDLSVKVEGCPPPPPKHDCPPPHHIPPMDGHMPPMPPMPPMGGNVPPMPPQGNPSVVDIHTTVEKVENVASASTGNVVKSPIVGTFYASPSPDKPPYVKVGDTVKKGDTIMIIESMKLMNEVTSEYDGVVKEILVKDGTPVEYDQPIMIIE
jgi:acetyl-CoA carboxylase biotin carboxyl carrier protein